MRLATILSAALCLVLIVAATAVAAPRRVAHAEAFGAPAFAGGDVVYPGLSARNEVEIRRVGPDGAKRVAARMGGPARGEERPFVALAGSAASLAAVRIIEPGTDVFRYTEKLIAGPISGPLDNLDFHCPGEPNRVLSHDADQPVAVDGTRLAFVRETCVDGARERRVVIRDLATGAESGGMPTSGVGVAFAGPYVALLDPADNELVQVYDLDRGAVAYRAPAQQLLAFDLQSDGKLVIASFGPSGCEGSITWYSPAEPTDHTVDGCDAGAPVAIERDRITYAVEGGLRVAQIGGAKLTRRLPVDAGRRADVLGFDGERITFATPGCSRDTGAIWVAAIADADTTMPRPRRCQVVWGTGPLRIDRRGRVTLRLRCPHGCRGEVLIEGRGRLYGRASFEQPARGSGRVRVQLRRTSRLFGRARSVTAVLHTFYDTTSENDLGEHTQRVRLRR